MKTSVYCSNLNVATTNTPARQEIDLRSLKSSFYPLELIAMLQDRILKCAAHQDAIPQVSF